MTIRNFTAETQSRLKVVVIQPFGSVSPHVTAQSLADGELEAADGAFVSFGFNRRPALEVSLHQPWLLVASAVAPQRLKRRELPVAGLALEDAACR